MAETIDFKIGKVPTLRLPEDGNFSIAFAFTGIDLTGYDATLTAQNGQSNLRTPLFWSLSGLTVSAAEIAFDVAQSDEDDTEQAFSLVTSSGFTDYALTVYDAGVIVMRLQGEIEWIERVGAFDAATPASNEIEVIVDDSTAVTVEVTGGGGGGGGISVLDTNTPTSGLTGILKAASNTLDVAVDGTDYVAPNTDAALKELSLTPDSLTGSQADSALTVSQTWNTTGTPTAILATITDTASNAASLLLDLKVGASTMFSVNKSGFLRWAQGGPSAGAPPVLSIDGENGISTQAAFGLVVSSSAGGDFFGVGYSSVRIGSGASLTWVNGTSIRGGTDNDTGMRRVSAGVIEINNGTATQYRDLTLRGIKLNAIAISALPAAASSEGWRYEVNDASSPTVGNTVSSGGSAKCEVRSNGTNWIVLQVF